MRQKKETRKQAIERAYRAERERDAAEEIACAMLNVEHPLCVASVQDSIVDAHYSLALYRVDRAHGGIVVTTFRCPGQRDSHRFRHLDELLATRNTATETSLRLAIAYERLEAARQRHYDAQRDAQRDAAA